MKPENNTTPPVATLSPMKSKEEWAMELRDTRDSKGQIILSWIEHNENIIHQIQQDAIRSVSPQQELLNAYKAGMTEAAEICNKQVTRELHQRILSARDKKEKI